MSSYYDEIFKLAQMMKIIITIPHCVIICMHRVHIYLFGSHMDPHINDISQDIDAFRKIIIKHERLTPLIFTTFELHQFRLFKVSKFWSS